jgi:3-phosphoshikimate 1-carboxyvinyltransferase
VRALRVSPPTGALVGELGVPGDKSIAHRALLLGALADGTTLVRGFPGGADVRATLDAIRRLGAAAEWTGDTVRVEGRGLALGGRDVTLDCANSGTTMRLGAGLVAGAGGRVVLDGDASLRRRPMERVAVPLRQMGARIATTDGHAPLTVEGGYLVGVDYASPVASAQVKSAVLLAGLRAEGTTRVREPMRSRDHTERMLGYLGVRVEEGADGVALAGGQRLRGAEIPCPGDPSSAAFLVVAALLVDASELVLRDIGTNPTRSGALDVLARMGALVERDRVRTVAGEPRADLVVRTAPLRATTIGPDEVPAAIDALPILAVAAAFADGETRITGAGELRVKESDRIAALEQLRPLGVPLEATADGLVVQGRPDRALRAGRIATHGDHRVAMAFAVAALRAPDGLVIDDPGCVDVSFPGFFDRLAALGARVEAA